MNTRLKQFLAAENITQSQFADNIKVVRASVSHVLSGRNKPGYDFIAAIIAAYPHLNIEWLLLGKGKMYKTAVSEESPTKPANISSDFPLLFDYDDLPPAEELQEIPQVRSLPTPTISAQTSNSMNTSDDKPQVVVKQRKATKIVIFFDDDTFQEIPANS